MPETGNVKGKKEDLSSDPGKEEEKSAKRWNSKLLVIIVIAMILIASISLYILLDPDEDDKDPINIAVILPLTGPGASIGIDVRDGLVMAVDEVNDDGGINGRQIKLIVADCETNASKAVAQFHEIEADHQPIAYITATSSISLALAPLAEEQQVLLLALVATAPELTMEKLWTYRYWPVANIEAPPVINALNDLGVRNLTLLYLDDAFGRSMLNFTSNEWDSEGSSLNDLPFQIWQTDFKPVLESYLDSDAIYVVGFPNHVKTALDQLHELDYSGVRAAIDGIAVPDEISDPLNNGTYTSAPGIYKDDFIFAMTVAERFQLLFDRPFNHFSANGYDSINIIHGLLSGREIGRAELVIQFSKGFIHPGVFGDIDAKTGDHDISFPLYPAMISDGRLIYL